MTSKFKVEVNTLSNIEFIDLSKSVGWGANSNHDMTKIDSALKLSYTVVVRDTNGKALGCARAFSDDVFMTFIPDIFVNPKFQKQGIGRLLVEHLKSKYGHTIFYFGVQPGNEKFFEKLGFNKGMQAYTGKFNNNPYF